MKKQVPKNVKFIRFIYLGLTIGLLSWILLWGSNSYFNVFRLERKVAKAEVKVGKTNAQNDSLRGVNYSLKTNPDVAEEVAREQHGWIKDDEVVWRFKPAPVEENPKLKEKGK